MRPDLRPVPGRAAMPPLWMLGMVGLVITLGALAVRGRFRERPDGARTHPAHDPVTPAAATPVAASASAVPPAAAVVSPTPGRVDRRGVIGLVGHCRIEGPSRSVGGRVHDTWALLGLLAENRARLVSRTVACEKLWPGEEVHHERFAGLLKETRAKLCDALGVSGGHGRILIQYSGSAGYRINPDFYTCDVWQIRDLLVAASQTTVSERTETLTSAVDLYTGPYLPDVPHAWARQAAAKLARDIVQALVELADAEGSAEREARHLERATALDGSAEHLYRRRMEAYARLGRIQAVHYCYDELNTRLRERARKPSAKSEQLYLRITDSS